MSREHTLRRVALVVAGIAVGALLVFTVFTLSTGAQMGGTPAQVVANLGMLVVGPVYAVTAYLILRRQPSNAVAWTMLAVAAGLAIGAGLSLIAPDSPPASPTQLEVLLIGLDSASWVFLIVPIFHLLMIFPTGHLLSRRWLPFAWLEGAAFSFMLLNGVFGKRVGPTDAPWKVANPIGWIGDPGPVFWGLWLGAMLVLAAAGLTAVVIRFRRSRGIERQQMKLLVFAVVFFFGVYGAAGLVAVDETGGFTGADVLLPFALVGIGLAIALALLRYRLYEIDRVVSRTVSYAIVIALLTGAVVIVATIVGTRFTDPLVVAATTLGVAAVFNPVRRRVHRWVDRRFNRSQFDHEKVISDFASTLRDLVDPEVVVDGWMEAVVETMQPAASGVWVREES